MSFWASLDWGSFAGGLVGAAGAFFAVIVADKRAEKRQEPLRRSKTISTAIEVEWVIDDAMVTLAGMSNNLIFNDALRMVIESTVRPLQNLLSRSAETEPDMYTFVLDTLDSVRAALGPWMSKEYLSDYEYRSGTSSVEDAKKLRGAVIHVLGIRYVVLQKMTDPWLRKSL